MLGNFSEEAQLILLNAKNEMINLNHPYIGTEHLILSLLKNEQDLSERLSSYGLTYNTFKTEILSLIGKGTKKPKFYLYTPLLKKIIENSLLDAKDNNNGEVTPEHLLASLLEQGEGIAIRILIGMNINLEEMYDEFTTKLIKKSKKRKRKLLIDDLGIDLVSSAKSKKIDPVIGREKELKRLIEILCRRTKNNPILIGKAGVGKTAIVEELANLIAKGEVPLNLQSKRIISLDMATLVSGTKYRGEFEERMQKIIKEVSEDENIILFIDEIHTLVGAGGAEGAIDASNILKPSLARGTIKLIGATTTNEYKKYIESDKALDRRFQQLIIDEPTKEETIQILKKIAPIYEKYHHVQIPNNLLSSIVTLSNKYIHNRCNPDKSIDVLDEVASMVSIKETKNIKEINKLKQEIENIKQNKNALILDNEISKAYTYLKKETKLTNQLNELELKKKNNTSTITIEEIATVISNKTNIPIYEIINDNLTSINNIEYNLKKEIIGQNKAIEELIKTTKKIRMGYGDNKVKSFLFLGPTGIGKTKLATQYAKYLYGETNLIRLDMSEYTDETSINKIIGSSPGYVGYIDNNSVSNLIKEKPTSIILLDEIDKAHPKVLNLLYQILDESKLTNNKNETINLNNNIIIMTSNLGYEETKVGFNKNKNNIKSSLKQKFPIPLINRIDSIITFNSLNEQDISTITKNKLEYLKTKYKDFKYSNNIIKEIVEYSEYNEFGARRIDKIISSKLESIIIDKILKKESININTIKEYQNN